jgi:DNA-binding response OmpR family regulator
MRVIQPKPPAPRVTAVELTDAEIQRLGTLLLHDETYVPRADGLDKLWDEFDDLFKDLGLRYLPEE